MGRIKRQYPLGKFRVRAPKDFDSDKAYPVALEYSWNEKVLRLSTNVYVKLCDWNQKGNQGRGELRASYGHEFQRMNQLLLSKVDKVDMMLAKYVNEHPNQLTCDVIDACLKGLPITRKDGGKDFVELVEERLKSEYARNKIGHSRYKNGLSSMHGFREFLLATKKGTCKVNSIYVGDVSVELLDKYINWRRNIKGNGDATINHALTPVLKACDFACETGLIDHAINAQIQDMRIVLKQSQSLTSEDESEFDGKSLTDSQLQSLLEYYHTCTQQRRKEYIEIFLFAYHACGLRVVDVMTLQWGHINFEKRELCKIMVKTNKRHTTPLSAPAIAILKRWQEAKPNRKFVFDLVCENLDLNDNDALYLARNNATKCINQSLAVVGEQLGLPFPLTMHVSRHTFAVHALNKGLSMSVISRLLGHSNTEVTEKVYAHYLPNTLATEMEKLQDSLNDFAV